MATPHVAGVVALMLEAAPNLTGQDVKKILLVTAQDLGPAGVDNDTGFGFVNAIAAVQVAKDPSLLDQPQFKERLAHVPDPPPEGPLERLSYWTGHGATPSETVKQLLKRQAKADAAAAAAAK